MEVDDERRRDSHSRANQPHGTKRHADDDLENSQRLAKRFHLLSLGPNTNAPLDPQDSLTWLADSNGKLWIPPQGLQPNSAQQRAQSHKDQSDFMEVEDTKDRIFVRDLDEELADGVNDEEQVVFIPEIDRRLNNLPKRLLAGDGSSDATGNELVLYNVPSSLSVSPDQDSVKKAIMESRARAQKQTDNPLHVASSRETMLHDNTGESTALEQNVSKEKHNYDEDAMEIG